MKGSNYLDYDKTLNKAMKLIRQDINPTFGLLVVTGINLGLRISDLLELTYDDLRGDVITIKEGKTDKARQLKVNHHIHQALEYFKEEKGTFKAFRSQKGSVYSTQHVNRLMKQHFKGTGVSSHSLRKTFGRRVWVNNNESEKALMYLSELFNHTSIAVTRRYLGIRQEELNDIYMNL
jgi:integrase